LSWIHWDEVDEALLEFTATLIGLRRAHPTFRRRRFFLGDANGDGSDALDDIVWLHLEGRPMEPEDWNDEVKSLGMYLNGRSIAGSDERGEPIEDDHFLLFFNAGDEGTVTLPPDKYSAVWDVVIDTAASSALPAGVEAGAVLRIGPRSVLVLREHRPPALPTDYAVAASVAAQVVR
ncbi:MAG: glycogen debranching enzyme, partial [Marmoricola sp.]